VAQATAAINLEVKGGSKLERIIQSVSRLESIVNNINAVPLKLDIRKADTAFSVATKGLSDVRQGIKQAQKDFNIYDRAVKNLEKDYVSAKRAVSKLTVGSKEHIDALLNEIQLEGRLGEATKKRTQLAERLQRQESKLPGAQRYLEEAERVRKLTVALTDLSDEYLRLGRSQTRTPVTGKVAASQTRGSIAQLQGQADALALVANNSEIASRQFNRFVVASQIANQKVFEGRQQQLKALAEGLALPSGTETRRQVGLRIGSQQEIVGARSLIGEVIASYGGIVKSEAALGSYIERLRSLQSIVPFDSQEWSLLETAINDVNGELRQLEQRFAGLRGQSSSLAKPIASLLPQFSVQSADKQARYKQGVQKKQEDQLEKLVDLEYEISKIKLDQNETLDLRNRLEKIFDDTTAGSIEAAKKQTVELKRQIRVIKDRNKEAGSDKVAGERPFATPLGGGAELKERFKTSRLIAEAQKEIADATELAANAGQRLIGLENSQQLRSALDDYTNGLKAIEEGADKILSKNKKLEQQFDRNLKQALASKRESLRVSEQFDSAVERVSGAETRIEIAAEKGLIKEVDKKKLLLGLDEARLAIDEKRFTLARTITSEVDRERKSLEGKVRPEVIKTGQVSPIEGRRKVEGAIRSAQILEKQLLAADKEGLNVSKELAAVKDAIASAGSDDYQNTRKTLGALLEANSAASDRLRLEKLIANEQKKSVIKGGTIRGGETLALDTPGRLRGMQRSGAILEQSLINLRAKDVDTSEELIKLQGALNKTKEDGYQITQRELDLLGEQLDSARKYVKLQKEILSGKSGGGGAGLEEALKNLRQARQAREQFLGNTSPAEAIDKIVREFNTGKSEAGDAAGNVAQTFAANLRKGIPEAVAASAALAGASIDAILKKLGIKSPSRVMIEIARNLVDTYVSVLQAAIPEIQQASQRAFAAPSNLDIVNTTSFPLPKNENITSAIAQSVASFVDPMQSRGFGEFQAFDLIMQKGRRLEPRNVPGIDYSAAEDAAVKKTYGDPEFQKVRKAYVEFYNIPKEFAPDIERASNAAGQASEEAKRLETEVTGLVSGLEQISNLLRGTADLVRVPSTAAEQAALPVQQKTATDLVGDYWSNAAVDAKELDERLKREFSGPGATGLMAMVDFWDTSFEQAQRIAKQADEAAAEAQKAKQQVAESFAPSVQKAEQLDEARRRQATFDAFAVARQQAEADARAASEAIASQITEPVKKSAPQGERKIQAAISSLFDRVSEIFKGIGGFGGRGGVGGGGGRGGAGGGGAGGSGDFGRRLEQAVAQGPEALLGLRELAKPATASIRELEALSSVLKEFRAVLDPTVEGFDRLEKQLRETAANLDRQLERRSPDADFLTRRFGPRGGRAVSEGLIGGAFPLLFGQGIGAAALGGLGGAAGGFAGGGLGFGLSLVGTALGTAFDTLNQAAQETGKSLRFPVESFEQLRQAGLIATRQQEYYISKLIEAGRLTEAAGEIQAEIIKKIGVEGVQDLQRLGDSSSRLSKAWAEFNLQLQAALAGPMAGLLDWVGSIVADANKANRQTAELRDFMQALTPEQRQSYLQRSIELRTQNNGTVDPAALQRLQREFLPGGVQQPQAALTQEELDKQKQAQAVTQELQAQVALQAKQLSLTGLTLERDGARYVNTARAVALQEYDNKLLEIKNGWIGKIFNAEQNFAQVRGANLELAARLRQINEEIAQRQEQLYQNSLQAEIALYQEAQKRNDLIVRFAAFNEGEEAGLKKRLSLMENIRQQRLAEFYTEAELAMIQARKNGTAEQTAALYASRLITLQSELDLEEGITKQQLAQLQLSKFIAAEESKRQAADPFVQFRETQQLEQQYAKTYYRLLKEGAIPAEAERIAGFERLVSERLRAIDSDIAFNQVLLDQARKSGVAASEINKLVDSIENLNKARGAVTEQATLGPGSAVEEIPGAKIQGFISNAEQELKDLESVAIRVSQGIGDAVGNSLTNGINGLIEGTATAKEVFAGFLKDVSQILLGEAAKMIATYIAIGIAKAFAFGSSGFSAATDFEMPSEAFIPKGGFKFPAANGAYFSDGVAAFANGGMFTNSIVSSPTLFKFADGGVTQMGEMGEAGPEAIMPLKRGPGGRLGVDASGVGGGDSINVVVNVDAKGTNVQGNDQQGNQLGRAISAAVQSELIKQKRPGGLLA
jgi:hypothetical protein